MTLLDELLELLRGNANLKIMLESSEDDDKIYPFSTNIIQDCIVYKLKPITAGEIIEQSRFEITCISTDVFKAYEILEEVKKSLITFGDEMKTDHIIEISQSGGSDPMETDVGTYHVFGFFSVKNLKY